MERRKLLQALTALPAVLIHGKNGNPVGLMHEIKPDKKYVVFVNAAVVVVDEFCLNNEAIPAGTVIHPVYIYNSDSMDEIIRIYEIDRA